MWVWFLYIASLLATAVAQCPSGPLGLSTTINGQTYFFKVAPTIAPGSTGPFPNPGNLVTDQGQATPFNLLSNGTVVDVATNGDLVYAFEAGTFFFQQPSYYYYQYNFGYTFLVTLSCSADASATFTAYALRPPYNGPPTSPQTATTFYACPYGDNDALQLTTTGTSAAPAAAPIGPRCILLPSIQVFPIQAQALATVSSATGSKSLSSPTAQFLNITTTTKNAAAPDTTTTNNQQSSGPQTNMPQMHGSGINAQTTYTALETTIVGPTVVIVVVEATAGIQHAVVDGRTVAVTSTILNVLPEQSITKTILSLLPSVLPSPSVCQCDFQSLVLTAMYKAAVVSSLDLGTTTYVTTRETSTLGVVTISNGAILPATPTIVYSGSVVANTNEPHHPGKTYETITVPAAEPSGTVRVVVIVIVQITTTEITALTTVSNAVILSTTTPESDNLSGQATRVASTLLTMSAAVSVSPSSADATISSVPFGNSTF